MAVRMRFYSPFAQRLAEQGIAALTVDYRGIGASRPEGSLRGFTAHFHDWGEKDLAGGLDYLAARFPSLPRLFVGHSAGAQLMGLASDGITRALFVAAGSAFWGMYRGPKRPLIGAFWYLGVPALTAAVGYLPMRAFRQGDDVPLGVAREWARWGKDPRYIYSYAEPRGGLGYLGYSGPLRGLAYQDDGYAPPRAMESLLSFYAGANKELIVRPGPMGHFGFFRRPELWPEQVDWLTAS